ncbi:MAG: hypothetical protein ACRYG4_00545 [Janthinobacterium lividum]
MTPTQLFSGINLGLTAASAALSLVIISYSGVRATRLLLAGRFSRSDTICQVSVCISLASLCWLGRRVFLLAVKSPIVAAAPLWASILSSAGCLLSIAALILCLMYRAERFAVGRGKFVAFWALGFVALSMVGGALSA